MLCSCGQLAHPCYGGVCEDCWALSQPRDEAHTGVVRVPAEMRRALTGGQLSGFWDSVRYDDSVDTAPAGAGASAPPQQGRIPSMCQRRLRG